MSRSFRLVPEAEFEYAEATTHYLRKGSPETARAFVEAVEARRRRSAHSSHAVAGVETPDIRRTLIAHFLS